MLRRLDLKFKLAIWSLETMLQSKVKRILHSRFVFQIVAVKAKTTTSKADDHEISLKLVKRPKGDEIKKGIASKLGIPNYINGSEATFYQVYKMMKFSSKIYYFIWYIFLFSYAKELEGDAAPSPLPPLKRRLISRSGNDVNSSILFIFIDRHNHYFLSNVYKLPFHNKVRF